MVSIQSKGTVKIVDTDIITGEIRLPSGLEGFVGFSTTLASPFLQFFFEIFSCQLLGYVGGPLE